MDLAYEISLNLRWPASRRRVGGNLGNNNTSLPNRRLAWFASSRSSFFFHLHSLQACSHPRRHPSSRRSVVRSIDRSLARLLSRELPVVAFVVRRSPLHHRPAFLALLQYEVRSLLPSDESHRGRAFAFEGPSRAAPALSPSTVQRPSPSCPAHPSVTRHLSGHLVALFFYSTSPPISPLINALRFVLSISPEPLLLSASLDNPPATLFSCPLPCFALSRPSLFGQSATRCPNTTRPSFLEINVSTKLSLPSMTHARLRPANQPPESQVDRPAKTTAGSWLLDLRCLRCPLQ